MLDPRPAAAFAVFTEIGIINQLATRAFEQLLPPGLSLPQFAVLDHLMRLDGDWTPARLASAFQVPRPTMTNTLQRLHAAGLVDYAPDPRDRRGKLVVITKKGRVVRDRSRAAVEPLLRQIGKALPASLFGTLLGELVKLRAWLDAARD